jgi:carbon storage regulator
MLILTRKPLQKIIINENIEVTILTLNNNQVKIGINAPKDIQVHREEIYNKIKGLDK